MRLGAFVTTLNRPAILKTTLQVLLSQTKSPDHILIVDNGATAESQAVVATFPSNRVAYRAMPENVGPAGAAAYALDRLGRHGCDWIYWGDDDNPPRSVDTIERLLRMATTGGDDVGAVGAVGAMWDWTRGEMLRLPDEALNGVIRVDIIAGGSQLIVRRETVANVGVPDSRLFFGLEDLEYCLRIGNAGYRLLVSGEMMMELRARAGHLNRSPRRSFVPHHSPASLWRQYYSTRSYIFAMNTTFRRPDLARRESLKAAARAFRSWSRGLKYGSACTALQLRAVVDGYLGHMGRTVSPMPKYSSHT